ncbi:MAG: phenylphosphate carboxylase subunit gamma [Deltaproteobacteria bacterium]|jgi:hypothetical protein
MARNEYDTFVLQDPATFDEDQEVELIVRELTPEDRRRKYCSFFAKAKVSKSADSYADLLWVRLGRGQLLEKPWSIEIVKKINKFPEQEA